MNIKLRNSLIPATFVHMRVQVHSGIYWKSVDISNDMLGHRFGEFSTTKNCSGQRDKNEERNRKTRKSKRKGSKHN